MLDIGITTVLTARLKARGVVDPPRRQDQRSSRATRCVDDSTRFLLLSIPEKGIQDSDIRRSLTKWTRYGLEIEGVRYAFLGFTDGHVKEGKLIFFREDASWTVSRFLECMGDLHSVFLSSGYGKYAARLSLSFSSTAESLDIPNDRAVRIDEWRAQDGSLHSDGCGMIRHSFADEICKKNAIPPDTSVFQIRRGGIKGLLVRYPNDRFDRLCSPYVRSRHRKAECVIAYRPSMHKYDGGPTVLEINDYSSCPGPARLNVYFILLLLTLGVSYEVFENLLQDQLDLIGSIIHDREKAQKYIRGELDASNTVAYNQDLYALLLAKHDLKEPYIEWRLRQYQQQQYDTLHKKLNVCIEDSCFVYGVVDEEGILEEDQVFINLPGRTGVLMRDVLVGRNPSYSPGDLRIFRAVNCEELKHLKYCIVFSRKAAHSIPDTMASGDLDGDEYFVTWEPSLIPKRALVPEQRAPAMSVGTTNEQRRSTRLAKDIPSAVVETFMDHKFNRLLRFMASAWAKAAQATPKLANDPYAQKLVPLLEGALDCMKSGADPNALDKQFHDLQRQFGNKSESSHAFRSPISRLQDLVPHGERLKMSNFVCDPALILERDDPVQWRAFVVEAGNIMKEFNNELRVAIVQDKEAAETGTDISSRRSNDVNAKRTDRVKQEYQDRYFGGGSSSERQQQRLRASAWYHYGYSQEKQAFAWLGERYLNEIRAYWTNGNKPVLYIGSSNPSASRSVSATSSMSTGNSSPMLLDSQTTVPQQQELPEIYEQLRSIDTNPWPVHPVASQPPHCCDSREHTWHIVSASRSARSYICGKCDVEVRERKSGKLWEGDPKWTARYTNPDISISSTRQGALLPGSWDPDEVLDVASDVASEPSDEGTFVDAPESPGDTMSSHDESTSPSSDDAHSTGSSESMHTALATAPRAATRHGIGWLLGFENILGKARSSSPISAREGISQAGSSTSPTVRARPPEMISTTPVTRTSGLSPPNAVHERFARIALVSDHPKPRSPVGSPNIPPCPDGDCHSWRVKGANGTSRNYECRCCRVEIKERKEGDPQMWVPYNK